LGFGIQLALAKLSTRIADQACPAADQDDGTMTGTLKAPECQEREQTAGVEAVGSWIEPDVDRARSFGQMLMQFMRLGAIGNQTSPLEVLPKVQGCRRHWSDPGVRNRPVSAAPPTAGRLNTSV